MAQLNSLSTMDKSDIFCQIGDVKVKTRKFITELNLPKRK